jgi:hypothetical protein
MPASLAGCFPRLLEFAKLPAFVMKDKRAIQAALFRPLLDDLPQPAGKVTDFTFRDPPNFNEGDHPISRKGPTLFQVVPKPF